LHRPLKVQENKIIFPIQTIDEIDLFQRLLHNLKDHVIISSDKVIFEPDQGFDIHEH
jgi:urease accessory protein